MTIIYLIVGIHRYTSMFDANLFEILNILGRKWAGHLLLFMMVNQECNFTQLKKYLKLTSRSLSKSLNLLEAKGLIEKAVVENPRKITYRLSDSGKKISEKLMDFSSNFYKS